MKSKNNKSIITDHGISKKRSDTLTKSVDISKSGFEAFGQNVPLHRLENAQKHLKEMLPKANGKLIYSIIAKTAKAIALDQPFRIVGAVNDLDPDLKQLDLTGRYRLLSILVSN